MSLIIPAYNEEILIGKTLNSVKKAADYLYEKTGEPLEIIVINNASTDGTVSVAQQYDVTIVDEHRHNIAVARNTGVEHAQGDILCFLDADSRIGKRIFYVIYTAMETGHYIGGGVRFRLDENHLLYKFIGITSDMIARITRMSGVLLYTTHSTFKKIGGFDEKFYCGEDLHFAIKLKAEGKDQKKKFLNIFQCSIITSSRKFKEMTLKDFFWYGLLLLRPKKMEKQDNCYAWYELTKRGKSKKEKDTNS